jgi:hydrogenase maturation protease
MEPGVSATDAIASAAARAARVVVIGYGSPLRGDDAVGRRVVEIISRRNIRDVAVVSAHQLTPELAPILAGSEVAIFVDAGVTDRGVGVEPVAPATSSGVLAHASTPGALLALARRAYGRAPRAYAVTVPVASVGFGTRLSGRARRGVATAVRRVDRLIRESAGAAGA